MITGGAEIWPRHLHTRQSEAVIVPLFIFLSTMLPTTPTREHFLHHPYPRAFCSLPSFTRIKRPRWRPIELNDRLLRSHCEQSTDRSARLAILPWKNSWGPTCGKSLYNIKLTVKLYSDGQRNQGPNGQCWRFEILGKDSILLQNQLLEIIFLPPIAACSSL